MEKKNKKKIMYSMLTIVGVFLLLLGITYAYWLITKQQQGENIITTSCLNFSLTNEQNDINIPNAYPIEDEEGKALNPYTFTIENLCESYVSYDINLEVLQETDLEHDEYIKVGFNEANEIIVPKILDGYGNAQTVQQTSLRSKKLTSGKLGPLGTKDYELRLWLDYDTPADEDVMEKTFKSKIVVNGEVMDAPKATLLGKSIDVVLDGPGLQEIEHNISAMDPKWNQTEYRYSGPNYVDDDTPYVHNYVTYNDELWRIIGLVNVKTSSNEIEQRVKIVRDKSIGDYYWSVPSIDVPDQYYGNDWTQAAAKNLLNGLYYNMGSGECYPIDYLEESMQPGQCDFGAEAEVKGLNDTARNMIDQDIIWSIGASSLNVLGEEDSYNYSPKNTLEFYQDERSTNVYTPDLEDESPKSPESYEWSSTNDPEGFKGVGLIYPSDYGYATDGGTLSKNTCLMTGFDAWSSDSESLTKSLAECGANSWLKPSDTMTWTITPDQSQHYNIFRIAKEGYVRPQQPIYSLSSPLLPTLYLKQTVKIVNGDGTKTKPYELENTI